MDKKKLIGSIIGVTLFALLVAGATYAWLTSALSTSNDDYNTRTKNFVVNFTKGDAIGSVPILGTPSKDTASSLTVEAYRPSTSAPGTLTIYLNNNTTTENNVIVTDGVLKYSYCIGSTCTDEIFTANTGTVPTGTKVPLITNTVLNTTATDYTLYFWLDGATINSTTHLGKTFTGYISAEANQTE